MKGVRELMAQLPAPAAIPAPAHAALASLARHWQALDADIAALEREIVGTTRIDPAARRLMAIPGIGPIVASGFWRRCRMPRPSAPAAACRLAPADAAPELGGGGTAYYVAASSGHRIRKVVERLGGSRVERISLGPVEVHREWAAGALCLERRTVHIGDNTAIIAQADTKTIDTAAADPAPLGTAVIRYRYTDHLDSTVLETDERGRPISLEQYHPFGTTAYRSSRPGVNLSLKRYRYIGVERDDETGLYSAGVRYYAAWLGRWTSTDPAGFLDGANLFGYARNNPVALSDPSGASSERLYLVKEQHFTGRETFHELTQIARGIPGWQLDPTITPENYQERYIPGAGPGGEDGRWDIVVPTGPVAMGGDEAGAGPGRGPPATNGSTGAANGDGGQGAADAPRQDRRAPATRTGTETVRTNPEGFTLEVPNNFDDEKLVPTARGSPATAACATARSVPTGAARTTSAGPTRACGTPSRRNCPESGRQARRSTTRSSCSTFIRTNNTVRPQDHRVQATRSQLVARGERPPDREPPERRRRAPGRPGRRRRAHVGDEQAGQPTRLPHGHARAWATP